MIRIGLDTSLRSTGFCVIDTNTDDILEFGVIRTTKDQNVHICLRYIKDEVVRICRKYSVNEVQIESLAYGAVGDARSKLNGVWFVVLDALVCDLKLPIKEISPKAVKKFACFGNAKKPDMWYALPPLVQELFVSSKWNKKSLEDITDAYFISMYK